MIKVSVTFHNDFGAEDYEHLTHRGNAVFALNQSILTRIAPTAIAPHPVPALDHIDDVDMATPPCDK